jgi:hypothetical protein
VLLSFLFAVEACGAQPLLRDLSEVTGELIFFDDEKAISVGLDQP